MRAAMKLTGKAELTQTQAQRLSMPTRLKCLRTPSGAQRLDAKRLGVERRSEVEMYALRRGRGDGEITERGAKPVAAATKIPAAWVFSGRNSRPGTGAGDE